MSAIARRITPVIGISGWKKSGKTTLAVRLIAHFSGRGLKVASLKHAHHEFEIDDGETDSARHRRAGASEVAVVGGKRWAIVRELRGAPEPNFDEVLASLEPCDLVIVEGYKSAAIPKIEARRQASLTKRRLSAEDPLVIAIASDCPVAGERVPVLALDDIAGIAQVIETAIGPFAPRVADASRAAGVRPAER